MRPVAASGEPHPSGLSCGWCGDWPHMVVAGLVLCASHWEWVAGHGLPSGTEVRRVRWSA